MSTIVVMPGGFHPFHAGHYALYKSAVDAFPGADVYVAATNDQSERPFPFSIKEKLAKVAGVAPGHFIQVKSPFKAEEITSKYDPNKDVLIFVRSEKDRNEQPKPGGIKKDGSAAYFQPYTGKNLQPFSKHAYFEYLPTVEFGPGFQHAKQIRGAWPTLNNSRKTAMVMSLYPATKQNPKLAANVVKLLDMGMAGSVVTESTIKNIKEGRLSEPLYWSELDEGLSIEGKMSIIEGYYSTGTLKESNSEDSMRYFNALHKFSSTLVKNEKYVIAPLILVNDRIMTLDKPDYMQFVGLFDDRLVFNQNGKEKIYPSDRSKELTVYQIFAFPTKKMYDKFKTAVSLKFDVILPDIESEDTSLAENRLTEWVDPGAPCATCGAPAGSHRVQFTRKNPKLGFIDPEDEWGDLEMADAEDHQYTPAKGYRPLSPDEAGLVGYRTLSGPTPDDIYDRIASVRQRISRVGKGAGKLQVVKEQGASSSSLPDVLYHGGENLISKFKIPPYGVFFSPHKDWAENYGTALTTAKVNATKVYVADSSNWGDPNSFDAKVLDALFDRDYKTLAVCVKVLMRRGYQALQTQTDSEMVVAFPGTEIQVLPPDEGVELKFNSNSLNESQIYSYFKKKYSLYESEKFPQRMVSSIKKINETDNHNEIKQFIHRVETFDYPGRIKVGDSLAVLDFEINFAWKEIEGRGFTQAKRITKISADGAGINYIEFEDGDRYPRLAKATFGDKQQPMEFAAYFKKSNDAEHAITVLGLIVPDTWEYNTSEIQRGNTSEVDEQFTTNLTTEGNLTEVFDSDSYPLEWEEVDYDQRAAAFTTDNGRAGEVLFTIWDYPNHKDVVYLEFAIKGKRNVTGGGDALKIFSTTINATKEFISKNPTNYILFDAEEENRKRLYIRMAKSLETGFELITPAQFAENYPEGQSVQESFGDVFIILQRRGNQPVEESEDPQLSKPIKPFNQVKQYPLTALL